MLEELQRRNFADTTIRTYLHGVAHFSRYFRRPPDQESLKKRGVADLILLPEPANLRSGYAAKWVFGARFHTWIPASESVA